MMQPAFFAAILLSLFLPYPAVVLLQEKADAFFDKKYSTKVTYFFRVMMLQGILAVASLAWMFMPQTPYLVLAVGVLIGGLGGAVGSSSMQLVSTLEPELATYNRLGNQCGSV